MFVSSMSAAALKAPFCMGSRALAAVFPSRIHHRWVSAGGAGPRAGLKGKGGSSSSPSSPSHPSAGRVRPRMKPLPGDPMFREVWRKFQLMVHPDLFTRFPELQARNAASLQKLQGILNDAKTGEGGTKTTSEALRARTESMEFIIRASRLGSKAPGAGSGAAGRAGGAPAPPVNDDAHFVRVPLTLRIPGPNCQHVVADALASLFGAVGLPQRWHWGPEYWGSTFVREKDVEEEER
jgi:hypothetical protein